MKNLAHGFIVVALLFIAAPLWAAQEAALRDLYRDEYDALLYGSEKGARAGFSVVVADINGDGLGDLIVGAPFADARFNKKRNDAGLTYVYFGRKNFDKTIELGTGADLVIHGAQKNDNSGFALTSGDVNGDGLADVVIGAPLADSKLNGKKSDSGITFIIFGRQTFENREISLEEGGADVELHSTHSRDYSGSALAAGDINGDGVDDLLVGAPFADRPEDDAGVVFVMCGDRSLAGSYDLAQQSCATIRGQDDGDRLGVAVAAGDLNADGVDDIVVGALETDAEGDRNVGQVAVFFGSSSLVPLPLLSDADFVFRGSYRDDYVGSAMAVGDINGDKTEDLLIGVAYADRNPDDGPMNEEGNVEEGQEGDAGKSFVVYGGASLSGELFLRDGADVVIRGTRGGANRGDHSGGTVAIADLNGDGYGDAIVGAPLADARGAKREEGDDDDVGAVFVVRGGKDLESALDLNDEVDHGIFGAYGGDFFGGLALTKERSKDMFFGGLANVDIYRSAMKTKVYDRMFSKSLAAGDINGDGYADLCIGAAHADGNRRLEKVNDAGAIYVLLGNE